MKRLLATSLCSVLLICMKPGLAQSPPPAQPAVDLKVQKCCYLGVSTSIAPAMLREQLNLPDGVGILIDDIDPNSPASAASLQANDLIEKLNDQWVINVQQFSVLIRMQKPGDTIRLRVIRHGQPIDVKVSLAEKALPVLDEAPNWLRGGPSPYPRPGTGRVTGIVTHSDSTSTITIIAHESDRQALIRDHSGKILFEGPINTPDDLNKLAPDLREKVERIEKSSEEHFRELRAQATAHAADTTAPGE